MALTLQMQHQHMDLEPRILPCPLFHLACGRIMKVLQFNSLEHLFQCNLRGDRDLP